MAPFSFYYEYVSFRKTKRLFSRCPDASCSSVLPLSCTHIRLMGSFGPEMKRIADKHTQRRQRGCLLCSRQQTGVLGSLPAVGASRVVQRERAGPIRGRWTETILCYHGMDGVNFVVFVAPVPAGFDLLHQPQLLPFTAVKTHVNATHATGSSMHRCHPPPSYSHVWI